MRRAQDAPEEFAKLYEHLAPALFAWARLRISPAMRTQMEAEDLVQQVWGLALASFDTYDAAKGSFRAWIFTIATRVLISGFRRRSLPVTIGSDQNAVPAAATAVSRRVARNEILARVIIAVGQLDATDQSVFIYSGLEGMTAPAAACLLGISTDAVEKRWQRLRARLRVAIPGGLLLFEEK